MKHKILSVIFLLGGCASMNVDRVFQDRVNLSIERQVKSAGYFLVDDLREKRHENAIKKIRDIVEDLRRNVTNEDKLFLELNYLRAIDFNLDKEVNDLVRSNPNDPLAYIIRGAYLQGKAGRARGEKWISETSASQVEEMARIQVGAIKDYEQSIELDKENFVPYLQLGEIYSTRRDTEVIAQQYYQKALEMKPESYWVWAEIILKSTPRWGGSYELTQNKIDSMKNYIKLNAKLSILQNYILYDKGDLAEINKNYGVAENYYKEALAFGSDHKILIGLGYINKMRGNYSAGCPLIREAVKQRPYNRRYNVNLIQCEDKGF